MQILEHPAKADIKNDRDRSKESPTTVNQTTHPLEYRSTGDLKPHPISADIYRDEPGAELLASVREIGIQEPLLITEENEILSGRLRHGAASKAGLKEIPVLIFTGEHTLAEAILTGNRQRVKTNEQIAREATHLMVI